MTFNYHGYTIAIYQQKKTLTTSNYFSHAIDGDIVFLFKKKKNEITDFTKIFLLLFFLLQQKKTNFTN